MKRAPRTGSAAPARGVTESDADDCRLQRSKDAEELLLLARRNLELVQRPDEVLDQRIEIGVGNPHAAMHHFHRRAFVDAWAAGRLADLVDQALLQPRHIGAGEETVDPGVAGDVADEVVHDGDDGRLYAETLV